MKLSTEAIQAFTKHVLSEYPKEACGLLINSNYIACENIHENPLHSFRINPERLVLEQTKGVLQAILHSHPYEGGREFEGGFRPEFPSAKDIERHNASAVPWGIVATDGRDLTDIVWLDENDIPPLLGRTYVWGKTDCFSLIRDFYKINFNITLKNVPREYGWSRALEAESPFLKYFEELGFVEIPFVEATIGDVVLMRLGDRHSQGLVNHCGVISGHNELLHQPGFNHFSQVTRLDKWKMSIAKVVRYNDK